MENRAFYELLKTNTNEAQISHVDLESEDNKSGCNNN